MLLVAPTIDITPLFPKILWLCLEFLTLPHPSSIKTWVASVDCEPGYLTNVIYVLSSVVEINHQCPNEALVLMISSLTGHFKHPVAYVFKDKYTTSVQAQIIKDCISLLHETGMNVCALVFEGCYTSQSTAKLLGCKMHVSWILANLFPKSNKLSWILGKSSWILSKSLTNPFPKSCKSSQIPMNPFQKSCESSQILSVNPFLKSQKPSQIISPKSSQLLCQSLMNPQKSPWILTKSFPKSSKSFFKIRWILKNCQESSSIFPKVS